MNKKTIIGHIDCPVCGFAETAIKEDKNGHAYGHCTDCNAQVFTRNDHRDRALRKRMRAVTVTVTEPVADPVPDNTAPVPVPAPEPQPKKKAGAWFSPILAGGAR